MKCPKCRHKNTRVTVTEHRADHTVRYCRCLNCRHKFKTEERIVKYLPKHIPSNAKLNHRKVREIRKLAEEHGENGRSLTSDVVMELAMKYGVEYQCIQNVITRKTWKNIK